MSAPTLDDITAWLDGIAAGRVDLMLDNPALAVATLALLDQAEPPLDPVLPPGYLTPHFLLDEFIASATADQYGIDNSASDEIVEELTGLAETLEDVRELLHGAPIMITSGYRCQTLNAKCGGVPDSAHVYGRAADFLAPAFGTPRDICLKLQMHTDQLGIDQLILELGCDMEGDEWVHLGLAPEGVEPRRQCLTIDGNGNVTGGIV